MATPTPGNPHADTHSNADANYPDTNSHSNANCDTYAYADTEPSSAGPQPLDPPAS